MRTFVRLGVVAIGLAPVAAIWTAFAAAPSDTPGAQQQGRPRRDRGAMKSTGQTAAPAGQTGSSPPAAATASQPAKATGTAPAHIPSRDRAADASGASPLVPPL